MSFNTRLRETIKKTSMLCVGLDPVLEKLPTHLQTSSEPFFEFNKAIIDATHDLVCGYKPNSAFYEARGAEGIAELKKTCDYIKDTYPESLIFFDAKRGDIGSTNESYAKFVFEHLRADAVTLHPYTGREGLQSFLKYDKGCIILCRTSNPGSDELQGLLVDGKPLYQRVAEKVSADWNTNDNCMLVVGATYPAELAEVRALVGDLPILAPGIGAQGGSLADTLKAGLTAEKAGLVIPLSRSVIYASAAEDFAQKSREEIEKTLTQITTLRSLAQ
ncbi:MAG: orotidine-5'-phosphate decarboxylase [Weeksellaceae bacterium]